MNKEITNYQYSIIQYYHDTTTHEFLNIGVAIYSSDQEYFKVILNHKYSRLSSAFSDFNGDQYRSFIGKLSRRFDSISIDLKKEEERLFGDQPKNLEALLRKNLRKDSNFRYSPPSTGIILSTADNLEVTINRLFFEYVEKYSQKDETETRLDDEIWKKSVKPNLEKQTYDVMSRLKKKDFPVDNRVLSFEHTWKNEKYHILLPLSFDLKMTTYIDDKADRFLGRSYMLNNSQEVGVLSFLFGKPLDKGIEIENAYINAKNTIWSCKELLHYDMVFYEEDEFSDFSAELSAEMEKYPEDSMD